MLVLFVFGRVHERRVTRKSDGSEFKVRFQEAEIRRQDRRPRVVEIGVREGNSYKEGLYTLAAESFQTDRFDRLELGYLSLISLDEAVDSADAASKRVPAKK